MLVAVDSIYAHAGTCGTHGVLQNKLSFLLLKMECWSQTVQLWSWVLPGALAGGVPFLHRRYIPMHSAHSSVELPTPTCIQMRKPRLKQTEDGVMGMFALTKATHHS